MSISYSYICSARVLFLIICRCVRPSASIQLLTINSPRLYCDFSWTSVGLSWVPFSFHSRIYRVEHSRLNWNSPLKSTWLKSHCVESWFSAAPAVHTVYWYQRNTITANVHNKQTMWILIWNSSLIQFYLLPKECLCSWVHRMFVSTGF